MSKIIQTLAPVKNLSRTWNQELREFIARSSAIDLAVGVSIGGAFTELVRSFTQNVVTPPIRQAAQSAAAMARDAAGNLMPATAPGPLSNLGEFGQKGFDFVVVALTAFVVAKLLNRFKRALEIRAQEASPHSEAEPAVEDLAVRQIAQNERIIELLETLAAQNRGSKA